MLNQLTMALGVEHDEAREVREFGVVEQQRQVVHEAVMERLVVACEEPRSAQTLAFGLQALHCAPTPSDVVPNRQDA